MASVAEIRARNLKLVLDTFGTNVDFAKAVGVQPAQISQLLTTPEPGKRKYQLGDKLARKMEVALKLPTHWFDKSQGQVTRPVLA